MEGDLSFGDRALGAVVDEVVVDPDFEFVAVAFDDHLIPFADGLFGVIREVQNTASLVLSYRRTLDLLGEDGVAPYLRL